MPGLPANSQYPAAACRRCRRAPPLLQPAPPPRPSRCAACCAQTLRYGPLMDALEVESVRSLEDLLITDCFYSGLLRGKLDQERQ